MAESPVFVLDADVFIEAAKRYYAFDIVPLFWDTLVDLAEAGRVRSIDRVKDQLDKGNDGLKEWADGQYESFFEPTADPQVLHVYSKIMNWAQKQGQFSDAAKAELANEGNADPWLVACSATRGCVLVTEEKLNTTIKRKIPIPNICTAFGVSYTDTFGMLRQLGVKFR